ncbi:MAG: amino acid aminotransferase [Phycisphaeraceae bacterium]
MFEHQEMAPPDPILGLTEAYNEDANPQKVNLAVGVYKDAKGTTPILQTVKQAEARLLETETTKAYKPIDGDRAYARFVQDLLFGSDHEIVTSKRAATAHTPGGTGALRVAGEYLAQLNPEATLHLSDPTWANHQPIFTAAGLKLAKYPYFDAATNGVNFDAMLDALGKLPAGDIVLLHGCCHNPTGADLSIDQWKQVSQLLVERGLLPVVDFAYQGFGEGLERDADGLRTLLETVPEVVICSSFSKNFGLYNERVGALTMVAQTQQHAANVMSHVKRCIRGNYSNPPAHGGAIVATILGDADLRQRWEGEVADMRGRINGMRKLFVQTLRDKGVARDFSFIEQQRGMFSFSGLTKDQVQALRDQHSIYIVGSGRINVAGMTEDNMDQLCEAIAAVL